MRRKDREVTDFNEIVEIIKKCDIIHIGLNDGDSPYIVPLNFSFKTAGNELELYIHGAKAGKKHELLNKLERCSFEMEFPIRMDVNHEKQNVTMRYESVMGKADVIYLEGKEKEAALSDILLGRYEMAKDIHCSQTVTDNTAIWKLIPTEISAKKNSPV